MKFGNQNVKRKIASLYYHLPIQESNCNRAYFPPLLSIFNSEQALVLRTQTCDITNSTAGLSEGCYFDFLSSITISSMSNCSAVCLRATGSRGRRMEVYTILWKSRRECCLRPHVTAIQTRFLVALCEKWLQPFFSDFEFIRIGLTFCFPLLWCAENDQLILRKWI